LVATQSIYPPRARDSALRVSIHCEEMEKEREMEEAEAREEADKAALPKEEGAEKEGEEQEERAQLTEAHAESPLFEKAEKEDKEQKEEALLTEPEAEIPLFEDTERGADAESSLFEKAENEEQNEEDEIDDMAEVVAESPLLEKAERENEERREEAQLTDAVAQSPSFEEEEKKTGVVTDGLGESASVEDADNCALIVDDLCLYAVDRGHLLGPELELMKRASMMKPTREEEGEVVLTRSTSTDSVGECVKKMKGEEKEGRVSVIPQFRENLGDAMPDVSFSLIQFLHASQRRMALQKSRIAPRP